jgi:RNA polymerase sigma factor (sigma-70 family)
LPVPANAERRRPEGCIQCGGGPTTGRRGARRAGAARRDGRLRGTRATTSADRVPDRVPGHRLGGRRRGGGAGRLRQGVSCPRQLPRRRAFRPWLLQIVVNEARNRRRSAGRREQLALRAADEPSSGGAAPSPEAELLAHERRSRLLAALAALREDDRDVVVCRHLLGLSGEETAQALALPVGTVKSRLSRALVRLRATLAEEELA